MQPGSLRAQQGGFTLVAVLAAVAVLGIGLAAFGPHWALESQRERELELLRVGQTYAQAIDSYYRLSPGAAKQYPRRLEDLLHDARMVGTYRHLRKLYPDPMGGEWGLVKDANGGIQGVFSTSTEAPLRTLPLQTPLLMLPAATRYDQWIFAPRTTS